MRRLTAAMLVSALLSLAASAAQPPPADPAAKAWIAQSNAYTDRLLAVQLEHAPERGSRQGLAKFDERHLQCDTRR